MNACIDVIMEPARCHCARYRGSPGRFPGYLRPANHIVFKQQQTLHVLMSCTTCRCFTLELFLSLYLAWGKKRMTGQIEYFQISWSINKYQSWRLITMYKTVIAEHLFDMIRFCVKVEVWQGMKNHHHFLISEVSKRKKYYNSNDMTILIRVICVHVMRYNCQ